MHLSISLLVGVITTTATNPCKLLLFMYYINIEYNIHTIIYHYTYSYTNYMTPH